MIKLSIIIPIYNSEKYLFECLNSIDEQNYKNYEVIMVDDGSKDLSSNICKNYANKNDKFKYFYQQNSGVSAARNLGLSKCQGEYIYFMDSDDKIENGAIEVIMNSIEHFDLLCFAYKRWYKNKQVDMKVEQKISDINMFKNLVLSNQCIGGFLWNKLFKNSIIQKNNIRFDYRINYSEDLLFVMKYLDFCKEINYISDSWYYYRFRKSNVSSKFNYKKNKSILLVYKELFSFLEKQGDKEIVSILKKQYNYYYYYFGLDKNKNYSEELTDISLIQEKNKFIYSLNFKEKIKIFFVNYFPKLFQAIKNIKLLNNNYFE